MPWAYHNLWAGYFPTFNIALIVGYPIQGHFARGLRGLASEETTQAKILMQGVEERIGAEARNALQSYQSALVKAQCRAPGARIRRSGLRERASQVPQRRVDDVSRAAASGASSPRRAEANCRRRRSSMRSVVELQRVEGTILARQRRQR